MSRLLLAALCAGSFLLADFASAEEPFQFQAGRHEQGELRYVSGLPVLTVRGTPKQRGEQIAELAAKPAKRIFNYPLDFLRRGGWQLMYPGLVGMGRTLLENFPEHHRQELEGLAAAGVPRDALLVGNTMFDLRNVFLCSSLLVEPQRSATGGTLLGRNLDFPTLGYLHEYSLVVVHAEQEGKHALVQVGMPGLIGCLSGMNDAGLVVSVLEVGRSAAGTGKFDPRGTPYALCYRRLLEECSTVEEALTLLRSMKRTTRNNLAVADRSGGGVFEITPERVEFRPAERGICPCTNHFRTEELGVGSQCWRYEKLIRAADQQKLGVAQVAAKLHEVNLGPRTLQTMVFEPATLKLHLSIGRTPASGYPLKTLELAPLFAAEAAK